LPFGVVPVLAQFIELAPLFRIAQDFVGLVDFLESDFGAGLVLGDIGVIFAGQAPIGLPYLSVARVLGHAEHVVIVFEFN
jgi:hypothetical protein